MIYSARANFFLQDSLFRDYASIVESSGNNKYRLRQPIRNPPIHMLRELLMNARESSIFT